MLGFTVIKKSKLRDLNDRIEHNALTILNLQARISEVASFRRACEESYNKIEKAHRSVSLKEYRYRNLLVKLIADLRGI